MRGRQFAAGAGVVVVMLVVATAFAVPYRDADRPVDPPVKGYLGAIDGGGVLSRREGGDGTTAWVSTTSSIVPDFDVVGFDGSVTESILGRAGIDDFLGELPGVDVAVAHQIERPERGEPSSQVVTSMLDEQGWALVAISFDGADPVVFDPPLPTLPADPGAETSWRAHGTLGDSTYEWSAEIVDDGPVDVELGSFDDCLTVESTLATEQADGSKFTDRYRDVYCRGVGGVESSVESTSQPAGGGTDTTNRSDLTTLAVSGLPPAGAPPLADTVPVAPAPDLGDEPWVFSTVVNQVSGVTTRRPAAIPELAPIDPPLLVVSTEGTGVLEAVRTEGGDDAVPRAWRHAIAGTSYGGILADAEQGRIFAGTTSGTVQALTSDGLFLWATDVGDNVATRPALVGDTVVVGSEDGGILGLDADDGTVRWRVDTASPVTSSPAVLGELVVLGSDEGVVRAIDPESGAIAWEYDAEDPVEAPIVALDDGVLVATRTGDVVRLDRDGGEVWTASTLLPIGTAPTVGHGLAVVAIGDFGGDVVAVDLQTGRQEWQVVGDHVGPVVAIEGRAAFVVAESTGSLVALDADGRQVESWDVPPVAGAAGILTPIAVGPVPGAGGLWVVDELGRVLRLGPVDGGSVAQDLTPVWVKTSADPPFGGGSFSTSPLVDGDDVFLIDSFGEIFSIDPTSGDAEHTGRVGVDDVMPVLPTPVADGTGYLAAQSTLAALALPSGDAQWEATVPGTAYHPATVAGDALVVTSSTERALRVSVFERATGELRWTAKTGVPETPGVTVGAAVDGDVVFTGDPLVARSLRDGSVQWRSKARHVIGGLAVVGGGRTVVVGTGSFETSQGTVVGVDAATGHRRWAVPTAGTAPDPLSDLLVDEGDDGSTLVLQSADGVGLLGIDPDRGELRWERDLPARRLGSGAAIDHRFWFALTDGRVLAVDPGTGATVGHSPDLGVDLSDEGLAQRPVAAAGTVLIPAGVALIGLDAGLPG